MITVAEMKEDLEQLLGILRMRAWNQIVGEVEDEGNDWARITVPVEEFKQVMELSHAMLELIQAVDRQILTSPGLADGGKEFIEHWQDFIEGGRYEYLHKRMRRKAE